MMVGPALQIAWNEFMRAVEFEAPFVFTRNVSAAHPAIMELDVIVNLAVDDKSSEKPSPIRVGVPLAPGRILGPRHLARIAQPALERPKRSEAKLAGEFDRILSHHGKSIGCNRRFRWERKALQCPAIEGNICPGRIMHFDEFQRSFVRRIVMDFVDDGVKPRCGHLCGESDANAGEKAASEEELKA